MCKQVCIYIHAACTRSSRNSCQFPVGIGNEASCKPERRWCETATEEIAMAEPKAKRTRKLLIRSAECEEDKEGISE